MQKALLMFPGQGSQSLGMGKEQLEKYPALSDRIWRACGAEIKNIVYGSDADLLNRTENAQPAICAVSLIQALAELQEAAQIIVPEGSAISEQSATPEQSAMTEQSAMPAQFIAVGHSLGEYAMFAAAGMITPEELFALVKVRAKAMAKCCEAHPGEMYAVIGGDESTLTGVVNYNSDAQVVIALEKSPETDDIVKNIAAKRVIKLAVSGAFHTPLMAEAAAEVRTFAESINWQKPQFPIWSNVTGKRFTEEQLADLPAYLEKHMVSPVHFRDEIRDIRANFSDIEFIDTYGKTLSGFVKKIN
jgi:[acyl-carrier-protein] S-malonyltransferase